MRRQRVSAPIRMLDAESLVEAIEAVEAELRRLARSKPTNLAALRPDISRLTAGVAPRPTLIQGLHVIRHFEREHHFSKRRKKLDSRYCGRWGLFATRRARSARKESNCAAASLSTGCDKLSSLE